MPYCYILFSEKLDKFYVGACIDLKRRLKEHNIGHSKFTRSGIPWTIKYSSYFETLLDAKQVETAIKKRKSRQYIQQLIDSASRI